MNIYADHSYIRWLFAINHGTHDYFDGLNRKVQGPLLRILLYQKKVFLSIHLVIQEE